MEVVVNLNAIRQNLAALKTLIEGVKVCAMIKADAYGHGLKAVANTLKNEVEYFGVANDAEALRIRQEGIKTPILITGALSPIGIKQLFDLSITQTVVSIEDIKQLEQAGHGLDKKIKVHIKLDTGMNRLGIKKLEELDAITELLKKSEHLIVEGVFTHFATADGKDGAFFARQSTLFDSLVSRIKSRYDKPLIVHGLSSGGVFCAKKTYDMVRTGLLLYGYSPLTQDKVSLKPALTATAEIVSIKKIYRGDTVSYGRSYTADGDREIAVIRAGYGDGYKRALSNKGYCMIKGKRANILGKICMDMFMADVTKNTVKIGDMATLIGENLPADEVAGLADTIPYEILTSLKPRTDIRYCYS